MRLIARARLRYTRSRRRDPVRAGAPTVLQVRPYTDADRQAWDGFVLATEGSHPAQLSDWIALTEETYGVVRRAWLAEDGGGVRGILPLFAKRRLGRPPVLFSPPGRTRWRPTPRPRARCWPRRAPPSRPGARSTSSCATSACAGPISRPAPSTARTSSRSPPTPEAQWRAFDPKLRNQIRKAERAGFTRALGRASTSAPSAGSCSRTCATSARPCAPSRTSGARSRRSATARRCS